jgi:hypothetical protein
MAKQTTITLSRYLEDIWEYDSDFGSKCFLLNNKSK